VTTGWKIAATGSETSGTWTNANLLACAVYRHADNYLVIGGMNLRNNIFSTTVDYGLLGAYTLGQTGANLTNMRAASSWVVLLGGCTVNDSDIETAPTGTTNRTSLAGASANEVAIHDTNGSVASFAGAAITVNKTVTAATATIELLNTGIAKSSGGGFRPVNIRGGVDQ
jgi:hypothetical protein